MHASTNHNKPCQQLWHLWNIAREACRVEELYLNVLQWGGGGVRGAADEQTWNCKLTFLSPKDYSDGVLKMACRTLQIQYTNSVQMQYKWTVDTNISWIQYKAHHCCNTMESILKLDSKELFRGSEGGLGKRFILEVILWEAGGNTHIRVR